MSDNTVSTLDGSTFLVSNPNGDVDARPDQPEGLFFKDTRHLSKWILTINGLALDVLSTDSIEYYYAQHFCIPPTGTIYKNPTLSLVRRRFVGNGFVEELTVLNHGNDVETSSCVWTSGPTSAISSKSRMPSRRRAPITRRHEAGARSSATSARTGSGKH